jgi:YidC/Oxa1 family membrane protein insertase
MRSKSDNLNLILAVVLSAAILFVWQYTYELPRQRIAAQVAHQQEMEKQQRERVETAAPAAAPSREAVLAESPRLPVSSPTLHGSIALKGLRFDDLTLANYRETTDPHSPAVTLLSPIQNEKLYFAQIGWISGDKSLNLPNNDTVWTADGAQLAPQTPVTLRWDNGQGVVFSVNISLDAHYLFSIRQQVENHTAKQISVQPYAILNRAYPHDAKHTYILHEGPLGVFDGVLSEVTYQALQKDKEQQFENKAGWLGITDKYWLTALAPVDEKFTAHFSSYFSKGYDRYQADYAGAPLNLAPGQQGGNALHLFVGAKELPVLEGYEKQYNIPLFNRAVDFGIYWFLTIPIFHTLNYFHHLVGNFGVAILLLTVLVKLAMYPLANKSYVAMNQMKRIQPQIEALKQRYGEDKVKMQQEMLALYKREKVNPAAGCLPMVIQIPVFFSLYKVLYVTIEMRQAPFIGWIRDLSAPDPTNIFTLFGLLHWTPPTFLHIGILPVLFCITMIVQQKLNPPPADPMQAKMFSYLPFLFLYMFSSFPAGLVIYWTWSNTLSILQQKFIAVRYTKKHGPKP